jgi:Zn-dependent protease
MAHSSSEFAALMILMFMMMNLGLLFFNMIPIPPLDGSRILAAVIPRSWLPKFYSLEPFGFLIIIGLEALGKYMSPIVGCNISLFYIFVEKPVRSILEAITKSL